MRFIYSQACTNYCLKIIKVALSRLASLSINLKQIFTEFTDFLLTCPSGENKETKDKKNPPKNRANAGREKTKKRQQKEKYKSDQNQDENVNYINSS